MTENLCLQIYFILKIIKKLFSEYFKQTNGISNQITQNAFIFFFKYLGISLISS